MNQLLTALRAAGESTRLRILAALRHGELTVSELTRILDQSQPRVSRHLKLLCDSGLLERHQEGAWVLHRLSDQPGIHKIATGIMDLIDFDDPELARDQRKLEEIRSEKARMAASYFSQHAEEWDAMRVRMVSDTDIEGRMIELLNQAEIDLFLDLGTGTGRILEIIAPFARKGIGFDLSREMLSVARSNLDHAQLSNCTVRHSDISDINLPDQSADAIAIHQVLHYCDNPEEVVQEAARLLKPNGILVIVDFLPHNLEMLRERHAHQRLGFAKGTISQWLVRSGFAKPKHEALDARSDDQSEDELKVGLWHAKRLN
ncbi:MAG: metalloregulator ArsR/SmtB family transcription factor [Granulosicoccus sp.]|nr:metalloregulator ArsR/SmtB family transcription factor [Granulosicoccus sp.]